MLQTLQEKCFMQITIDLPQDLEQELIRQSNRLNIPLETLILQSLRQLNQGISSPVSGWSELIQSYEGVPDFSAFESYRNELLPSREPDDRGPCRS
jgi:hypothetical protein